MVEVLVVERLVDVVDVLVVESEVEVVESEVDVVEVEVVVVEVEVVEVLVSHRWRRSINASLWNRKCKGIFLSPCPR